MHMNDAALRAAVEKRRKQLKRPDEGRVQPQTWEYLHRRGIVEDARTKDFDDDVIEYLVKEINELAAATPGGAGGPAREGHAERAVERLDAVGEAAQAAAARLVAATAGPGPAVAFGSIVLREGKAYNAVIVADQTLEAVQIQFVGTHLQPVAPGTGEQAP